MLKTLHDLSVNSRLQVGVSPYSNAWYDIINTFVNKVCYVLSVVWKTSQSVMLKQ